MSHPGKSDAAFLIAFTQVHSQSGLTSQKVLQQPGKGYKPTREHAYGSNLSESILFSSLIHIHHMTELFMTNPHDFFQTSTKRRW